MTDVPMPRASPRPPMANGEKTDPAIALERLYAAHKEQEKRKTKTAIAKWTSRGTVAGAFLAALFATFRAEGTHTEHAQTHTATQQAIEDEKHQRERDVDDLKRLLADQVEEDRKRDRREERMGVQLELLLDAAKVPRSKRPPEDE